MTIKPQDRIETELRTAMKAREASKVATLRMLLAQLKNQRIADGEEVDEAAFLTIVRKLIKQRHEAAELYTQGGRDELAAKETAEAETLSGYLPEPVGYDELRSAVASFITEEGLSGPASMGRVMKEMSQRFAGRADNRKLSELARELLTS